MINLLMLFFIFLENSLVVSFPYNIIALPYITYLAYKKGKSGVYQVILICILISNSGNRFIEISMVFILVFVSSYFLSKAIGYDEINVGYFSLIQFLIYSLYLFMKLPNIFFIQLLIMFGGYLLVNYIFVKKSRKRI